MILQTPVHIPHSTFEITPSDRILFVGSCFADNIGRRFSDNLFNATVNPYGVMYNPASVKHTVSRIAITPPFATEGVDLAVFTLGTNHVYVLNETGEIVDNCQKRPQSLFTERQLTIDECVTYLAETVDILRNITPKTKIVLTVSPIRYAKYGFHGSMLSKATLLLAANKLMLQYSDIAYFPAYEIMNDELRDYRFYAPDMLHPSEQAIDYIFDRFRDTFFSKETAQFYEEWQPIKRALQHRPFNAESEEYQRFIRQVKAKEEEFKHKWNI